MSPVVTKIIIFVLLVNTNIIRIVTLKSVLSLKKKRKIYVFQVNEMCALARNSFEKFRDNFGHVVCKACPALPASRQVTVQGTLLSWRALAYMVHMVLPTDTTDDQGGLS